MGTSDLSNWVGGETSSLSRAQTATIGIILVFGMVLAGSILVITFGSQAISETEGSLADDRAEKSLTQFDSKAALVALGNAGTQSVEFPRGQGDQLTVNRTAGTIKIDIQGLGGENSHSGQWNLGKIEYNRDGLSLAYQGGGVWRQNRGTNESVMISPPEFHYRQGTLVLPIIRVNTSNAHVGGRLTVDGGKVDTWWPNSSSSNPLDRHRVFIEVQSEYYKGWGRYFEERTDGEVTYEHPQNKVILELLAPANHSPVAGGLVSGANAELDVKNKAKLDSYNSSNSRYGTKLNECRGPGKTGSGECPDTSETKILASGPIKIWNNAKVFGDLEADGHVTFNNNAELRNGNISHGGVVNGSGWDASWNASQPLHWEASNASVKMPNEVATLITQVQSDFNSNNNNGDGDTKNSGTLTGCGSTCEVPSGQYWLQSITLNNGENMVVNTTGGDVDIYVDGDIEVTNGQSITVKGDNRAHFYINKNLSFFQGSSTQIVDDKDDATQLWFYMRPTMKATLENKVDIRGVVFGPPFPGGDGTPINLDKNAEVYGAVVGDITFQGNNVWIHYDEKLANTQPVTIPSKAIVIKYLHVSENEIRVSD